MTALVTEYIRGLCEQVVTRSIKVGNPGSPQYASDILPRIPSDVLLYHIIDIFKLQGDVPTLYACARTCRAWYHHYRDQGFFAGTNESEAFISDPSWLASTSRMLWHSEKARRYYQPFTITASDADTTRPICRTLPLQIVGRHQPTLESLELVNANCTSLHPRFFHHLADYRSVDELSLTRCSFRSAHDLRRVIEALQNLVTLNITAVTFKYALVLPERLGREATTARRRLCTVELCEVRERDVGPLASVLLSLAYPIEVLSLKTVTFQSFAQFRQIVQETPTLARLKLVGVSCQHIPTPFMTNHAATTSGETPAGLRELSIQAPPPLKASADFAATVLSWFARDMRPSALEDLVVGGPHTRPFSVPLRGIAPRVQRLTMVVATQLEIPPLAAFTQLKHCILRIFLFAGSATDALRDICGTVVSLLSELTSCLLEQVQLYFVIQGLSEPFQDDSESADHLDLSGILPDSHAFVNVLARKPFNGLIPHGRTTGDSEFVAGICGGTESTIAVSLGSGLDKQIDGNAFSRLLEQGMVPLFEPWFQRRVLRMRLPGGIVLTHEGRFT